MYVLTIALKEVLLETKSAGHAGLLALPLLSPVFLHLTKHMEAFCDDVITASTYLCYQNSDVCICCSLASAADGPDCLPSLVVWP